MPTVTVTAGVVLPRIRGPREDQELGKGVMGWEEGLSYHFELR